MSGVPQHDGEKASTEVGAELIVVVWWLAGLDVSFLGSRFLLLLAPGLGIMAAIAAGRLYELVTSSARLRGKQALALLIGAGLAAAYIPAMGRGYATARNYLPTMTDSWWDTLTNLRQKTPPDAIVNVWWDYGYWVKYVAERRVSADGATLLTHLPYWLGRVLVSADDTESAGLLRMMSCGSDATPMDEGRLGAYGKLHARLKDAIAAQELVVALARSDRDAAAALLAERGFSTAERDDILASTHCAAPETYLIIGTDLLAKDSWMRLAAWDFRRAYIARQAVDHGRNEVVDDVVQRFGFSAAQASSLYDQSRQMSRNEFVIGPAPRAPSVWYPCRPGSQPSTLICPLGLYDKESKKVLEDFTVDTLAPERSTFSYREAEPGRQPGASMRMAPGALVLADSSVSEVALPEPRYASTGVLLDARNWRILVGPPPMIRSTFLQLLFLDGRYSKHFEKFDERTSIEGGRLVTWRVKF